MSKGSSPGSGPTVGDGYDVHVRGFVATLATMGYARTTQHEKRWVIARFVRWARRARLAIADLDDACVGRFLARRRRKPRKMDRATVQQFLDHLRGVGVVPPCCALESVLSSGELLLRKYLEHLRSDRGLCGRSIEVYAPFARAFVDAPELPARIASLDAWGLLFTDPRRWLATREIWLRDRAASARFHGQSSRERANARTPAEDRGARS